MTLLSELGGEPQPPAAAPPTVAPRRKRWWIGLLLLAVLLTAGATWTWRSHQAQVSADVLQTAVQAIVNRGEGPGTDPVCVANGLAYDDTDVNVEIDNRATLDWMKALVRAGLYAPGPADALHARDGSAVQVYRPLPALDDWGGARRLCIARAVQLLAVRNVGQVESMRFRGQAFTGVSADVVWTLADPAPWLASADVALALAAQMPAWRGARWTLADNNWTLVQRRNFFLQGGHWLTSDALERANALPPRPEEALR